jgi:uncharacterized protein with HEPN domain
MPRRDWRMRVRDALESAERILAHTAELSQDEFVADEWTVDAVLRNLTIIGESARHIPDDIIKDHSQVPWQDIRDIRNIIVHEYFGVDLSIIWRTIQEDLPRLIPQLKSLLAEDSQ